MSEPESEQTHNPESEQSEHRLQRSTQPRGPPFFRRRWWLMKKNNKDVPHPAMICAYVILPPFHGYFELSPIRPTMCSQNKALM